MSIYCLRSDVAISPKMAAHGRQPPQSRELPGNQREPVRVPDGIHGQIDVERRPVKVIRRRPLDPENWTTVLTGWLFTMAGDSSKVIRGTGAA